MRAVLEVLLGLVLVMTAALLAVSILALTAWAFSR